MLKFWKILNVLIKNEKNIAKSIFSFIKINTLKIQKVKKKLEILRCFLMPNK